VAKVERKVHDQAVPIAERFSIPSGLGERGTFRPLSVEKTGLKGQNEDRLTLA
jgi:hypothetical protein